MISPNGKKLAVWMAVFTALTLVTLGLRIAAQRKQRRAYRADDYLVIFATASMIALEGCTFWAIDNGLGAHAADLSIEQLSVQFKLEFAGNITWTLSTGGCKIAVLYLYLVIFTGATFKKITWAVIGATVVYAITLMSIFIAACKPVEAAWDPLLHAEKCWPWMYHSLAAISLNVLLDVTIVVIPMPMVWKIQMPLRKKIGVSAMFSLGLSIVAIMLWRLGTTVQALTAPADFSYALYTVALQCLLELWLGLIATNLPTIAPLFPTLLPVRVKQYFSGNSSEGTPRGAVRTFGSSGRNPRRDDFSLLTENAGNELDEMSTGSGGGISRRREVEVIVESSQKGDRGHQFV